MNLKECILDNIKCENIIVYKKKNETPFYIKKDNKLLLELELISFLNQKVYNSIRVGNEKIEIWLR